MNFTIKFGNNSANEILDKVRNLQLTIISTDKKKVKVRAENEEQIVAFLESGL